MNTDYTSPMRRQNLRVTFVLLATTLFAAWPLFGQETGPTGPDEAPDEELVTLSPFEIRAETETGWVANESLAGSRLRTDLKDLASPIEVLTKEFMDEFALNSAEDATIYTTNVEGAGDGYEAAAGFSGGTGFPPLRRIRGIQTTAASRNFFESLLPSDNYNLDRVTVAAGPNNLLFGSSNPAGVIDSTTMVALPRNHLKISGQWDSNASQRYTLDVNRAVIPKRLAVRVAMVEEDKEFAYKPASYENSRQYVTLRFTPWDSTIINVGYERIDIENIRPQSLLPYDRITPWYNASSIAGYQHQADATYANWTSGDQPGFRNSATSFPNITNTVFERVGLYPILVYGESAGSVEGTLGNFNNTVRIKPPNQLPGVSPLNNVSEGWTLLDDTYYPTDVEMTGLSKLQTIDSDIYSFSITQRFLRDFFAEFAAQHETSDSFTAAMFAGTEAYTVEVDPNLFNIDGVTPNPNFGRMYMQSRINGPYFNENAQESTDWRLSLSYEFDFASKGNSWWRALLGRQRIGGMMSERRFERKAADSQFRILPEGGLGGREPVINGITFRAPYAPNGTPQNGWATNTTRSLGFRYYISKDDPVPPALYDILDGTFTFTDANGAPFTIDMRNTGFTDASGRRLGSTVAPQLNKTLTEVRQLAYQGFFWDNRFVATFGWREDTLNSAAVENGAVADAFTGLRPIVADYGFLPFDDASAVSGTTRTLGGVVRPFHKLVRLPFDAEVILGYNESDTFSPETIFYSPFGQRYEGSAGEGEDISVMLNLWKGRFSLEYSSFEASQGPTRAGNTPFNAFRLQMAQPLFRMLNLYQGNTSEPLTPYADGQGWPALGTTDPYAVMSDVATSGDEITLNWNVTDAFQLRFNFSKMEVVETNIGQDWWDWLDAELPKFQALTFPEGGVGNEQDVNGNGVIDTWTWDTAWRTNTNPQTVAAWWEATAINGPSGKNIIQALDGRSNDFVRNSRFNINAVYRFKEGALRGFSVGAAYRFRDEPLLGYGAKTIGATQVFDLENPLYGVKETYFDLSLNYRGKSSLFGDLNYRVGLNVRNLFDEDGYIPRLLDVNGSAIRLARVTEPRVFILSLDIEL